MAKSIMSPIHDDVDGGHDVGGGERRYDDNGTRAARRGLLLCSLLQNVDRGIRRVTEHSTRTLSMFIFIAEQRGEGAAARAFDKIIFNLYVAGSGTKHVSVGVAATAR